MPTLLVTKRMSKELRARVEAAVRADLRQRTLFPNRARRFRYLRVLLGLCAIALTVFLVVTYRQSRREVEERRAQILVQYGRMKAQVPGGARAHLQDLARLLSGPAAPAANGALPELLARPSLYVRAERRELERKANVLDVARESAVDALATCLVTPPVNLRESTLLRAIGRAPAPDRVFAFGEALETLDFFDSNFQREVETAQHMQELERLASRLQRDSLTRGLGALEARVLLSVVDEPKASGVISDFDGEAPHDVVLTIFEVESGLVLWQSSTPVDPAWISEKSRLSFSRPLDSCRLAFELLDRAPAASTAPAR
jgi:hypothetical protein